MIGHIGPLGVDFSTVLPPVTTRALRAPLDALAYVTTERLAADTRALIAALGPDVDLVIAISRSGLFPGALVAYHLHLPLLTVSRQTGLINPGHGVRMEGRAAAEPRHVLLIDDTVAGGGEMAANMPTVRAAYPDAKVTRAVIYAHPEGKNAVDLYVSDYPGGHYLEWNWCNAGHGARCGYDFDGILCRDFTAEECSSPERYRQAMATIEPLYLPRRTTIPLVVTARPEWTRDVTLAWLDRYGVKVDRLVMRDFEIDPARGWSTHLGEYKAWHYAQSDCVLFAESEPDQARVIADRTNRPVLCPALGRVVTGTRVVVPECLGGVLEAQAAGCRAFDGVAGVCGTPQPRGSALAGGTGPGLRSTADPCHPMLS